MTFSIIIPVWRGVEMLKKNLPAVLKLGADEVILIDDASPENDNQYILKNFPHVKLLTNQTNRGFGETVNRGVLEATSEIMILLNQDVFPHQGLLKHLKQDFQEPQVFGVSFAESGYGPTEGVFDGYISHRSVKPLPKKVTSTFWISGGSG